jgi:hypothetical protein
MYVRDTFSLGGVGGQIDLLLWNMDGTGLERFEHCWDKTHWVWVLGGASPGWQGRWGDLHFLISFTFILTQVYLYSDTDTLYLVLRLITPCHGTQEAEVERWRPSLIAPVSRALANTSAHRGNNRGTTKRGTTNSSNNSGGNIIINKNGSNDSNAGLKWSNCRAIATVLGRHSYNTN